MNNNVRPLRSASDKQSYKNSAIGTRHSSISTPNNNIHININLNVKKKSQCLHAQNLPGKKINNFIQVNNPAHHQEGFGMMDQNEKQSQQLMKSTAVGKTKFLTTNKKSQTDKKTQKTKKKKTKQKINSKPFTPEKQQKGQSQQKSFQKSKTGKKLAKKKQSKSMQNIKVFRQKPLHLIQNKKPFDLTQHQKDNKLKSKSNSSSKQKSREKSSSKLNKNRTSSKNIVAFQNSGIKKVLTNQRQTITKGEGIDNLRKSKKSLKVNKHSEKDMVKIHEFMEDKKKNQDKKKKQGDFHTKGIRIKDELLKASRQKKEFFSKPQKRQTSHAAQSRRNLKFPIYFGDEDDNEEVQDVNVFHIQRNTTFVNHKTPQKSRVQSLKISPEGRKKSGTKRVIKQSVYDKFQSGKLTDQKINRFYGKIIKIQAWWRGILTRKKILQEIARMNRMAEQKKMLIYEKKSQFWDDDDNNSITNLQFQKTTIKQKQSNINNQRFNGSADSYNTPSNSNYNSSSSRTDQIHTNYKKYESQSGNQVEYIKKQHENRIRVDDFKRNIQLLKEQKITQKKKASESNQKLKPSDQGNNSFLISQIELLKQQLQEQNKKFSQLQKQNSELKQNLMSIVVDKQKQKSKSKKVANHQKWANSFQSFQNNTSQVIDQINADDESIQIIDIKMAGKSPKQITKKQQAKKVPNQHKFKNLKIQTGEQVEESFNHQKVPNNKPQLLSPSSSYVQNLKKQLSSFQSPSNRMLKNAQLSGLMNLQKAFKKKELSIDMTYEKSSVMYQQMLQNNIVSPRTYNFKKIELQERYKKQKQEINMKFKQAQKVIKYISEQIVQEEKAGDDQSPQKVLDVEQDVKIEGVKNADYAGISQRIDISIESEQQQTSQPKENREQNQLQQYISPQIQICNENNSGHSNFRNYWTDDIEQVHKRVIEISHKIDKALEGQDENRFESLKSQEMKQTQNQLENSNFYSVNSVDEQGGRCDQQLGNNLQINNNNKGQIHEQSDYQIVKNAQQQTLIKNNSQNEQSPQVMANDSNVSSTSEKSSRNLQAYNIHYPSSPSNEKNQHKHHFEAKETPLYEEVQHSLQNNSQLSQNRSSFSQSSLQSRVKQPRGFDTRLTFIKQYCIALCEFIRSQDDLKLKFIQNISTPLKYDYFQYLKSYRTTINFQPNTQYNSTIEDYFYPYFKLVKGPVIEKALNEQNTGRFDQLYNQSYGVTKELTPQMVDIRKFFIHAIIDVFNQSLDFQRPGSIYGEPLPWLVQSRNLKNNNVKNLTQPETIKSKQRHTQSEQSNSQSQDDERLDRIFGIAIAKIIQWGSCLCGFIPEPATFDGQQAQPVNIDEEQTNLVRQTRLAYMLEKSLGEEQQKMVDHTMQQLQVQLQLQHLIYQQLLDECTTELLPFIHQQP